MSQKKDLFGRDGASLKHITIEENPYLPNNYQMLLDLFREE
jgi:hypothetical protein